MNVIEKIIANHSDQTHVKPGDIVMVAVDMIMSNDATTTLAMDVFNQQLMADKVFDPDKLVIIMDHYTPSSTVEAADTHNKMRQFAQEQGLSNVYDGVGVCHQIMLEKHVVPGQVVIGADSHTCTYGALGLLSTGMGSTDIAMAWKSGKTWMRVPETIRIVVEGQFPKGVYPKDLILKMIGDMTSEGATYKALCFEGPTIEGMEVSERATIANMAIEAGAKFAYMAPNDAVENYLRETDRSIGDIFHHDADATFENTLYYNVSQLEPQIAFPHCLDHVKDISQFKEVKLNQLFLGACTNGRYEDLEIAAAILKGKKIAPSVRFLVTPASNDVYMKAMTAGIITTLVESGAMIGTPGCSACFGGTIGLLGKGEKMLSTANRNFRGRVGSKDAEIYLASPAVVAASALTGRITDPREV